MVSPISCTRAFPREVIRSTTRMGSFSISGAGGSILTLPVQVPASVFSLSKDFCASDCPNAAVDSAITTSQIVERTDFMLLLLKVLGDVNVVARARALPASTGQCYRNV